MHVRITNEKQAERIQELLAFAYNENNHLPQVKEYEIADTQFEDSPTFDGCVWLIVTLNENSHGNEHKYRYIVSPDGETIFL